MKNYLLYIGVLTLISNSCIVQKKESQMIHDSNSTYTNHDIKISFKGSIEISQNNPDKDKGYFYESIEVIRFNENDRDKTGQSLKSELEFPVQRLRSEMINIEENDRSISVDEPIEKVESYSSISNSFSYYFYLSALFIMPKMTVFKLKKEVKKYIKEDELFEITEKMEIVEIGDKEVLKWRAQNGKTRLDHYVIFGKEYNYLFVSSPYGSSGVIENVIAEMELLEKENK